MDCAVGQSKFEWRGLIVSCQNYEAPLKQLSGPHADADMMFECFDRLTSAAAWPNGVHMGLVRLRDPTKDELKAALRGLVAPPVAGCRLLYYFAGKWF